MHFTIFLLLFGFHCVQCKNNVKALTESRGQEIIEMGAVKDLPPGLEEEPPSEFYEEENSTITTLPPATNGETKTNSATTLTATRQMKADAVAKEDVLSPEEDETRIEKEMSEIYKDTDYKSEPDKEVPKAQPAAAEVDEKPIARTRTNFKFQPDMNDRADVERFRTSIDEISCEKRVTQQLKEEGEVTRQRQSEEESSASSRLSKNVVVLSLAFIMVFVCQ